MVKKLKKQKSISCYAKKQIELIRILTNEILSIYLEFAISTTLLYN